MGVLLYSAIKRNKPLIQNMGESQTYAEEYILSDPMHVKFLRRQPMVTESRSLVARGHGGRRRLTAKTCWGGENVLYLCSGDCSGMYRNSS